MRRFAFMPTRSSSGVGVEFSSEARRCYLFLKNTLRQWRAADVAKTYEKYAFHRSDTRIRGEYCETGRDFFVIADPGVLICGVP